MKTFLEKYLIEFGQLDLLQTGQLKYIKLNAFYEDGKLIAPKEQIIYDTQFSKPSKHFYQFIANAMGISTTEAINQFEQFIHTKLINQSDPFVWPSIGYFTFNNTEISWNSNFDSNNYYLNVPTSFLSTEISESINDPKKYFEFWWIAAILISLFSVAAILLKYKF